MNIITKYLLGSALVLSLYACKKDIQQMPAGECISYVGHVKSVADTALFEKFSLFSFESTSESLLGRIEKIVKYKGNYYVLDKQINSILAFDGEGKFLHTIGRIGNGAGEYVALRDVIVDADANQLLMLVQPSAIHFYNLDSTFDRSMHLDAYYDGIAVDEKNIYISNSPYVNNQQQEYSLTVIDKKTEDVRTLLPAMDEIAPYCNNRGMSLTKTGNAIYYTRRFDNRIYSLSDSGVKTEFSVDWGKLAFPEQPSGTLLDCKELDKLCRDHEYVYTVTDLKEGENNMLFRTNLFGVYALAKQENKIVYYDMIMNSSFNIPLPNYLPVYGEDDEVFFIYPAHMLPGLRKLMGKSENDAAAALRNDLSTIKEDDNPLIFRYSLK